MKPIAALLVACSLLSACSVVPAGVAQQGSTRTGAGSASGAVVTARSPAMTQRPVAVAPQQGQCLAELNQAGAQFTPVVDNYFGNGCSTVGTVQLAALSGDSGRLSLGNIGPVQCGVGSALAAWARFGVDRAARQLLGSPLQRIETFGSYSCRNVAGSQRRSAHATAGAIDISAFVLADGRRITVAADWHGGSAAEKEFLRTVQRSACRRFDTVLGPEYNAAHHDHLHLEGVMEGNSFCR
jgi:hypothetical protein